MKKNNLHVMNKLFKAFFIMFLFLCGINVFSQEPADKEVEIVIDGPDKILSVTLLEENEIQVNGGTGSLRIQVEGGWPYYTYVVYKDNVLMNPTPGGGNITSTDGGEKVLNNLEFGKYKVEIRDEKFSSGLSCNKVTSGIKELFNPPVLEVNASVNQIIKCKGEQGSIKAFVKGGKQPNSGVYTLELFKDGVLMSDKGGTLPYSKDIDQEFIFENLEAGSYKIEVHDGYIIKTVDENLNLTEPDSLLTLTATDDINVTHVACNNGETGNNRNKDGSITVTPQGGEGPYSVYVGTTPEGSTYSTAFSNSIEISNLYADTYFVNVKDSRGCITSDEIVVINQPASPLTINPGTVTKTTSQNGSDGSTELTVSGGTEDYSYIFSGMSIERKGNIENDGDKVTIEGLAKGTYTFTVTDKNGCKNTESVVIEAPIPLDVTFDNSSNVNCHNGNDGVIYVKVTGGATNTYKFLWYKKNGVTWDLVNDISTVKINDEYYQAEVSAGEYKVKVIVILATGVEVDENVYNKDPDSIIITQPSSPLTIGEPNVKKVSCKGGNDGSISLEVSGGTGSYTYEWRDVNDIVIGEDKKDLTGVGSGTYKVIVTDENNCVIEKDAIIIPEPSESLSISFNEGTDVLHPTINKSDLNGTAPDGRISISASNGWGNYVYAWKNEITGVSVGTNSNVLNNVGDGIYSVTVTDDNGTSCAETISNIVLTQPNSLGITINLTDPTSKLYCNGDTDGSLKVEVLNGIGTKPYTYHWYKKEADGTRNFISGANNTEIHGLAAGTYGVEVTVTNRNGIEIKNYPLEDFPLEEPAQVHILDPVVQYVDCFGEATGEIIMNVEGGTGNYIFEWYKDGTPYITQESEILTGLEVGEYRVLVQDTNNCPNTPLERVITITQPEKDIEINNLEVTYATGYNSDNGIISIEIEGGTVIAPSTTAHYTYTLTRTPDDVIIKSGQTVKNSENKQSVYLDDIVGSFEGITYEMTITDAKGCTKTSDYTIKQPKDLLVELSVASIVECNGYEGELSSNVTGGWGSLTEVTDDFYTYQWYNVDDVDTIIGDEATLKVKAGTYKLKVIDSKGNYKEEVISLEEKPALLIDGESVITHVDCKYSNTGSIEISATGGTQPYKYFISTDGGNTFSTEKAFTSATSTLISDLYAGNYKVKISDAYDCVVKEADGSEKIVDITITEPDELLITNIEVKDVTGHNLGNGIISIVINGGTKIDPSTTAHYTYTLMKEEDGSEVKNSISTINTDGVQSIYLDDIEGSIDGITYIMTVTDAKGCFKTEKYTIKQPEDLIIEGFEVVLEIDCNGNVGSLRPTSIKGGYLEEGADYDYKWYNILDLGTEITNTRTLLNVEAGIYRLVVTDSNNNTKYGDTILTEPEELKISYTQIDVECYDQNTGSIDITVTGGTTFPDGTYSYSWSNGEKIEDLTGLHSGVYKVTVTDSNNCFIEETITITQPEEYKILVDTFQEPTGAGLSDGRIAISVVGGTPGYTYQWFNESGALLSETNQINNIPTGEYKVIVRDSVGCLIESDLLLQEPEPLMISIQQIQEISCNGDLSGALQLVTEGGVGGNIYTWYNTLDDSEIGSSVVKSGLAAGTYYVKVVDANGIEAVSELYTITQPAIIEVSYAQEDLSCFESEDGKIFLEASGGTGNYYYRIKKDNASYRDWQVFLADNNTSIENLSKGNYQIQVRDEKDCFLVENDITKVIEVSLTQPDLLVIEGEVTDVTGFELTNGNIITTVTGGTEPYIYEWKDELGNILASTSSSLNNVKKGIYTLIVEDAQNCIINKDFVVEQPDKLEVLINQQNIVLCNGDQNASLNTEVTGGVPFVNGNPYKYEWYRSGSDVVLSTNSTLVNIGIGSYYVIVTDANNNITQSEDFIVAQPDVLTVQLQGVSSGCGGNDDWEIISTVSGGTAPYTYFWSTGDDTKDLTNVSTGNYFVVIRDANGCQVTENISLTTPNPLTITANINEIICYNKCSGSIDLTIEGGMAPYDIHWNTGQTTDFIDNLCHGDYTVTVTDQKGCSIEKVITINNAEEYIFEIVPNEVTLCEGETIEYDVTMNSIQAYEWTSDNGFSSNNSIVELVEAGVYTLKVTTNEGCEIFKEVLVQKSDAVIDVQFILASQAFAGEDIVLINVSNPVGSIIEWKIPSNVEIIQETNEGVVLRFNAPGDYDISLTSIEGNCKKTLTKTVIVQKARNLADVGDSKNPFIKEFKVYANPNNGKFKASVDLEKEAEISLRLYNLSANSIVKDQKLNGQKEYEVDYDINVPSGIYLLLLETSKGSRISKVIIN
ncbi:T9SS type A sorting domain-containing protein [Tenacibaculum sp. IB213877]|uniref:T9SS type A sorting domain-containing protein n=1 Tax=Tenacibaculum sp. IB213877 TaxID=3097351 RepID=UPI002A5AE11C|nr:T9SS type A sorting domain-containing protein [Tenacibaculum sp. IB213877]MDY0779349.1 T9SS type A sorting domain-containing protein [Tenacibaculum sp. IB213877]